MPPTTDPDRQPTMPCPACGQPIGPAAPSPGGGAGTPGQRWSFIWRPPSGDVCPECGFHVARYLERRKWARVLGSGIVVLTVAFLLYVSVGRDTPTRWMSWLLVGTGAAGATASLVGLVGLIVGGRRGGHRAGQAGNTRGS